MTIKSLPTVHDIEVLSVKTVQGQGNLKAFASIRIGALEIHGLRVVQQRGQRAWVSMPQVESERDGKKCYYPMMKIHDKGLKQAITEAVLEAWQKGESGNGNGQLFRGMLHR
jgi:DNA-binding cell septation regulator SpoVG